MGCDPIVMSCKTVFLYKKTNNLGDLISFGFLLTNNDLKNNKKN